MISIAMEDSFSDRCTTAGVVGRWSKANEALPWSPSPTSTTQQWVYDKLRQLIVEVSREEKEESGALRVLTMLNAAHPKYESSVGHLYSGLQLLLPREDMHSHRHAATAIRFVHQSDGGWTAVDGNKIYVEPNDVIVTPSMLWHEHGNDGDDHVIWQDCTDDPLVTTLATSYFELHPQRSHLGESPLPWRKGMMRPGCGRMGPQELHYPWSHTVEALECTLPREDGVRALELVSADGGSLSGTTGARFLQLPSYGVSAPHRQTGAQLLIAVTGPVEVVIDDIIHTLARGDTIAVPSWKILQMKNPTDVAKVLITFDESPMLTSLGLFREEEVQ